MKIIVVFKQFSDKAREVFEWIDAIERRSGVKIETIEPESKEGEGFCVAHDIVEYPTVLVTGDDGKVFEQWRGTPMPQIDAVMAYVVR